MGFEGPYVLCPHSMSGLEAVLWAQKYPDKVEAIVGLDMPTCLAPVTNNALNTLFIFKNFRSNSRFIYSILSPHVQK